MESYTEDTAIWQDVLCKSYFPNGSPWFIANNVFWQYCCVSRFSMEPKGLKRDIENLSVKFKTFFCPQKVTKNKDLYKEKRFWTKPLNFLWDYLIFMDFTHQAITSWILA